MKFIFIFSFFLFQVLDLTAQFPLRIKLVNDQGTPVRFYIQPVEDVMFEPHGSVSNELTISEDYFRQHQGLMFKIGLPDDPHPYQKYERALVTCRSKKDIKTCCEHLKNSQDFTKNDCVECCRSFLNYPGFKLQELLDLGNRTYFVWDQIDGSGYQKVLEKLQNGMSCN